jgi:uncharacterized protein YndB with AHSA1/START domain
VTKATQPAAVDADREIVMERAFYASRSLVFQAYTQPQHVQQWFGPKGFTVTTQAIDIRPGGSWQFVMHGPDGTDWDSVIRYQEIVKDERLVYDMGHSPDGPAHFHVTITFSDDNGKTLVRQQMVFPTAEACAAVKGFGAIELGYQTLDKLAEHLKTMAFTLKRTFDAPRERVYKAWSEPERFAQWWGPKGFALEVKKFEFKPQGVFHYRMSNEAGMEMWGKFVYLELTPPERIVWITSFSDAEGNVTRAPFSQDFPLQILNCLTFTEHDGKTTLELIGGPISPSDAEGAFYAGMQASMEQGFKGTFDQLDEFLAQG